MPIDRQLCKEAFELVNLHGSLRRASRASGIPRDTISRRLRGYKPEPEIPQFPEDDLPTDELIDMMCRRFEKRQAYQNAVKWFPVKVNENKPIGLAFVGDPHVDDNGCNWPLLKRDCEIMRQDGIYAVNIGDTENNWGGRLLREYANQDTSKATSRKLAKWLLTESGVRWWLWLLGNHDNMGDTGVLQAMNSHRIPMVDWEAQFKLCFPGWECRIWAAHNFSGHSQWNTLHGPQKSAHLKEEAHLYICGHHHNWALHQEESGSRDFVYWLGRCRGYKFIDSYATKHGHQPQQYGATILAVINPLATREVNRVQCFADLEHGADYLGYLRKTSR